MKDSRRRFLATGGAGVALGALGIGVLNRTAWADHHCEPGSWGSISGSVGGWTCDTHEGYKILEIFLRGGASQWESFWLPGGASPTLTDYGLGDLPLSSMNWGLHTADFPCQPPDVPTAYDNSALFEAQSGGGNIYWGAPTRPLHQRSDIFSRCRMVTQYHEFPPHEAAVPYVLSGLTLGNPRRAGTGAAIQRRARVVDPSQQLPVSFVLHRSDGFGASAAAETGTHPGFARPVVIRVQDNDAFVNNLARNGISAESDELLLALRHEQRDRLRFRGGGSPVRSDGFESYWVAAELLEQAPAMQALFPGGMLVRDTAVAVCPELPGGNPLSAPGIKTMLQAAASLLTSGPARHVCVIDTGIAGTYDSHGSGEQRHLLHTSANIYNVMHHLADIIQHPTANPDGVLDLDTTMVVLSTEFNRTPTINANNGRDHWTVGGMTLLCGGPLTEAGGRSILGAIDADGYTTGPYRYSATDIKAMMLLVAGVDPFADGNFRFGDFSDAVKTGIGTEDAIRDRLKGVLLGL